MRYHRVLATVVVVVAATLSVAGCSTSTSTSTTTSVAPSSTTNQLTPKAAMDSVVAFDKAGLPDLKGKTVAFLGECVNENPFCKTRASGLDAAAKKLNIKVTSFSAAFSTNTQLTQVQDAVQRGFDGYIFSPVADAAGCANYKLLQATGKPIVTVDSPMCGDAAYTPGTAGFVTMTDQAFYERGAENAFKSCDGKPCKAVILGGVTGTDLFARWERAVKEAAKKYPNVDIVVDQPANFSPSDGLAMTQDALSKYPDIQVVYTQSDDTGRGIAQAVTAAGKKPGTDVRIYTSGGDKEAVDNVTKGVYNGVNVLLPYDEGYYPAVILAKALATGEPTPGFSDLQFSPSIVDGPGSSFVTSANAATFHPQW